MMMRLLVKKKFRFSSILISLLVGVVLAACAPTSCGDGVCGEGEYPWNCSSDCTCGDGVCRGENCCTCPDDCGTGDPTSPCDSTIMNVCGTVGCGDGMCQPGRGEFCDNCSQDCGSCDACGNQVCEYVLGETCTTCPEDCHWGSLDVPCCGNGVCDAFGEDQTSCSLDCGSDGQVTWDSDSMPQLADVSQSDEGPVCGNGILEPGEHCETGTDCVIRLAFNNNLGRYYCDHCQCVAPGCNQDGQCQTGETADSCPEDCADCGDGLYTPGFEVCDHSDIDGRVCGDGQWCDQCQCVATTCNYDGVCQRPGETNASCTEDCVVCGDQWWATNYEECEFDGNCPAGSICNDACQCVVSDQPPPPPPPPPPSDASTTDACGDGTCDPAVENSDLCPQDCHCVDNGECEPGEGSGCMDCGETAGGCGAVCQDNSQCAKDLVCVGGLCWHGCVCGGDCEEPGGDSGDCACKSVCVEWKYTTNPPTCTKKEKRDCHGDPC